MRADTGSFEETAFEALTGDAPEPAGEVAAQTAARNFLCHVGSLSMSKLADGLVDPKLVLAWLVTWLGAPAAVAGALVPLREAGALLPQLFIAGRVRARPVRKWFWAGGSLVQGGCAAAMVGVALALEGLAAGLAIAALLAVLALARSVCSVSYKDVLGKTVAKRRRGAATGIAASVAAAGVVLFAGLLIAAALPRAGLVLGALALAAVFWTLAAALFSTLEEPAQPAAERGAGLGQMQLLRQDPQLARFVAARALLVGTALAPPYLVVLAAAGEGAAVQSLGALVLASALASLASSWVWGRLADRSSRRVLILSGLAATAALAAGLGLVAAGLMARVWAAPLVLFGLMIAYHGVRQGRSTYLVDMAPEAERAAYTAVSNTVIGVWLLLAGGLGAAAALAGPVAAVALFAGMSLAGAAVAAGLDEVE